MKEELQGKLVEILTAIQSTAGQAKDFALEQLPDIAQSYVAYGRAWALVDLTVAIAVGAAFLLLARWAWKNPWKGEFGEDRGMSNVFLMVVFGAGSLFFLYKSLYSAKNALLVWVAPKVWLLKEIASLIK